MEKLFQTKFSIGIPTINRSDLLNITLEKYYKDFPNTMIFIIDNGKQDILKRENNLKIIKPARNIGVSDSWNMIMGLTSKLNIENSLILNDDIYLGKNELDILAFIKLNQSFDFILSTKHFCSFVLPVRTFKNIGEFDNQFFPAYFEDNDYKYRLSLAGLISLETEYLTPVIYRNSMSIKRNPDLNSTFPKNEKRYIVKWGGLPENESYIFPYNKRVAR